MRRLVTVLGVVLSFVGLILLAADHLGPGTSDWTSSNLAQTEKQGNNIVAALESFRFDNGFYPVLLDELAPEYIGDIPTPAASPHQWHYNLDGSDFILGIFTNPHGYPGFSYSSKRGRWILSQW